MVYTRILLIDDDEDDQEIFLSAVKELAPEVECTAMSDASEALKMLADGRLSPDVIFLDLNMPVMTGQQFLAEIKKRPVISEIPVIIFSTSSHAEMIRKTMALGASDFITKPGRYDALMNLLRPFVVQKA